MQTKDKQLAQVPVEKLAQQVVTALQTEEGQKQLAPLFQQFQAESKTMFEKVGKMDQAVKRLSEGDVVDHTSLYKSDDGRFYDEQGNAWTSKEEWVRSDAQKNPKKYSPVYPKLGMPLTKEHHYLDRDAVISGEPAERIQKTDGSVVDQFGNKVDQIVSPKPEIRHSGNDPIMRYIINNDTVYMMNRPTRHGYEGLNGKASDDSVSKYRERVNTGWN